ncbi:hypothetical protein [Paenibacillus xerothermodurans]|uniref:Uncharacterized protein n=1 Tax=Paenibacillus xerothermodurans TaxID=1977292 RepID=A0A2W1NW12_PAEXE|nr:hypothetical protein [Paenibacillus xerothermodurans]PZE21906.1 hypothetical protein CBW46_005755 [Paenibacillus xerothermodurans]
MKLRLLPIVLSVAISAIVLFGGWFVYQSVAMENPLTEVINNTPGVELVNTHITNGKAELELKLQPGTNLREVYSRIQKEGAEILGDRVFAVKVVNESSPEIDSWWSSALFDVAQSMETRQYAEIPKNLQERAAASGGSINVSTEMDDKYVYIALTDGEKSKYVMLPRTPTLMGVWPNE